MTPRFVALALLAITPFAGCQCGEPLETVPDRLPIGGGHGQGRVLTYVGDEPLAMFFAQSTQLRFTRKNADGSPVEGERITIEVHGTAVTAPGDSFITDAGGGIEVPVVAGTVEGESTVVARAKDVDGSIDEAVVHIDVRENPVAGIVVSVSSQTRIPVTQANARILVGTAPPTCADILAGSPEPAPQLTQDFTSLPATQSFAGLPAHTTAVVVVDGYNAEGAFVARGCGQAGPLPGGIDTPVDITLTQGQSSLAGDYDVLMHMALGDALPHPYDTDLDLVTALLADPAGFALYFVLREIDRETGFTTFVTRNGVELSYDEVSTLALADPGQFPTWSFARDQLDQLLTQQLGQTYTDVTNIGAGLRDVVTDFEVGTRLDVVENDDGTLTVNERWKDIVLYWPLPCADGDLACARKPLTLDDLNLAPVTASYGASADYAPDQTVSERYAVTTDPHGMNLRYGALLVAILEQVVFPSLPGGQPGDDFGDFLTNLIPCSDIASSVTSDPTASQFVSGVCDAGLQLAGGVIQTQLEQLQIDAADPTVAGLQQNGSFALLDKDQDLVTETVDEYEATVGWSDPNDGSVYADISAPITGAGIRARPACVDDGQCAAGFACAPRPSYLKVARAELGCERARGPLQGGEPCLGDGDCASGLCTPVGAGGALQCFQACTSLADCGGGDLCAATGGSLDLDPVMNGLGDVAFPGCAAP